MLAPSSSQNSWDICFFDSIKSGSYNKKTVQVKSWDVSSKNKGAIKINIASVVAAGVQDLYIVVYNHPLPSSYGPVVYKIPISKLIVAKGTYLYDVKGNVRCSFATKGENTLSITKLKRKSFDDAFRSLGYRLN
jgi:hypothetical protein